MQQIMFYHHGKSLWKLLEVTPVSTAFRHWLVFWVDQLIKKKKKLLFYEIITLHQRPQVISKRLEAVCLWAEDTELFDWLATKRSHTCSTIMEISAHTLTSVFIFFFTILFHILKSSIFQNKCPCPFSRFMYPSVCIMLYSFCLHFPTCSTITHNKRVFSCFV